MTKKLKLKIKGNKKPSKTNSSNKSRSSSSTPVMTSRFNPEDKFHLVTAEQGETKVYSFVTIAALQEEANKLILSARVSGLDLHLWVFEGTRCPISSGPIPRLLVNEAWVSLVDDFSATVDQCPKDGLIVGEPPPTSEEEELDHLDTDEVSEEDGDGEVIVEGSASQRGEDPEKVLQIFNQPGK